jgi:hypothetical protein
LPNGPDQWLAAKGLSTPQGFIASPLHRVVIRHSAILTMARFLRSKAAVEPFVRSSHTSS